VNLSPADDILISVERPLGLDTREQMVASIMSKKIAAGSTHLLLDLPVGPSAKLPNPLEAMRLRKLFEFVGNHFGVAVEVIMTDGRQPIGNGIGPVLEVQDVMAVLENDSKAPSDLREKSLRLAAHLLDYDPDLRGGKGCARARELLESGAALKQMQKIINAQGPSGCLTELGALTMDIPALHDGVIESIDCLRLNRLARTAGAPIDKGAGIKISRRSVILLNRASRFIAFTPLKSPNSNWLRQARKPTPVMPSTERMSQTRPPSHERNCDSIPAVRRG
jgi:thymidine phosphorylase